MSQETQQSWEQQVKPKLVEIMQPKLAEILNNPDTVAEITKVLKDYDIPQTKDTGVQFQLDIKMIESNQTSRISKVEATSMGCVYYPQCPDGSGGPCVICK